VATTAIKDRVAIELECQAHQEESWRPTAGYPASLMTNMERGKSLCLPYVLCLRLRTKNMHEAAKKLFKKLSSIVYICQLLYLIFAGLRGRIIKISFICLPCPKIIV
jgi:hypothetical protein